MNDIDDYITGCNAGYAAAREQAARVADRLTVVRPLAGGIAADIRAMSPDKGETE